MANIRPVRFPNAPAEYTQQWGARLVNEINLMYNDLSRFRTATGVYAITATAVNRTITATYTATEVREFLIQVAKDLQDRGILP